jgi:hypothetical protein
VEWPLLFIVGGWGFWLLVLGVTVVVLVLEEWERGTLATLTCGAAVLALQFWSDLNPVGQVVSHPGLLIAGIAAYFAAGTAWAVIKWWLFVHQQRAAHDALRGAFGRAYGLEEGEALPDELRPVWQRCLGLARDHGRPLEFRPPAARHKARILRWMAFWPWSLLATLWRDPVRLACEWLYHQIVDHLQAISDRAFHGADVPWPEPGPAAAEEPLDPVLISLGVAAVVAEDRDERRRRGRVPAPIPA